MNRAGQNRSIPTAKASPDLSSPSLFTLRNTGIFLPLTAGTELIIISNFPLTPPAFAFSEIATLPAFCQHFAKFNLLPTDGVEVSATSVNAEGQEALQAIDGHEVSAWFCAATDTAPVLTISIKRAVRTNRVVIAQAPPNPLDVGKADYAQRVSLRINKTSARYEVTAPVDRRAPTVIDLGKDVRIKHMEIYLLDRAQGSAWPGRAGINELQLQFVEKDGSLKEQRKR